MQNRTPPKPAEHAQLPHFHPVPRKYRHDGWTPDRQRAFIDALADTGSVKHAAKAVNMSSEGNVAILLRDREPETTARIGAMTGEALISVITHVELEGGVYSKPGLVETRRASLNILMETLVVLPFENEALEAYSRIVAVSGYARSKILDRMIAATALVHALPLITINGADFRDIQGLELEVWPAPAV